MQVRQDAYMMSRSASKHVIFALGIDPTGKDAGEGRGFDLCM